MKKLLVTTDFSASSKAALRFAIQLASQNNDQLTFFHSYNILRLTGWSEDVFYSFENSQKVVIQKKLIRMVKKVYRSMNLVPGELDCVVRNGLSADRNILEYAKNNQYNYICISRRGTGKGTGSKIFGSIISRLITKSKVPVIAIPENYRRRDISKICYASDLVRLDEELLQVIDFAGPLKARVEIIHFKVPIDYLMDNKKIAAVIDKLLKYRIESRFETLDNEKALIQNMIKVLRNSKPSLMIMFTQQNRSLFEKIFLSSYSAEFAFITKTPLLVFNK